MKQRYKIQFPRATANDLGQDEAFFYLVQGGEKKKYRLHDYNRIYNLPGLYEQIIYDRLKCQSPSKVADVLRYSVSHSHERFTELRVLDLGAGNGMVGEELKRLGVARTVGVDIIPEALQATERDRPDVYDAYYVRDFCNLADSEEDELRSWSLDCMTSVAALGFGDIPTKAFMTGFNLVAENGWVAFNIKETFLDIEDQSGFSKLIRALMFSKYLELYHLERYRHRYSMDGEPLYYYALGARKRSHVPDEFLQEVGVLN